MGVGSLQDRLKLRSRRSAKAAESKPRISEQDWPRRGRGREQKWAGPRVKSEVGGAMGGTMYGWGGLEREVRCLAHSGAGD